MLLLQLLARNTHSLIDVVLDALGKKARPAAKLVHIDRFTCREKQKKQVKSEVQKNQKDGRIGAHV